jgi:putative N6-adenine-specific DNA methylase
LIFASDKDPLACGRLEQCTLKSGLSGSIRIANRDFFELAPSDFTDRPGVVTINPPYGRRIGTATESRRLLGKICQKLAHEYKGWMLVLIAPYKTVAKSAPFRLTPRPFRHGGLKLGLIIGKIG